MKIKRIILKLFLFTLIFFNAVSDEINFEAKNIELKQNGKILLAYDSNLQLPSKNISIDSKKAEYNKIKNIIYFKDQVFFQDYNNKTLIKSDYLEYNRTKDLIISYGKTNISYNDNLKITTDTIYYDRKKQILYGSEDATIKDDEKNIYNLNDKYNFDLSNQIIKAKNSLITDKNNNKYFFEDLQINLKIKEIIGKEIKLEFEKSYFGNPLNSPLLKGRSAYSNNKELKVYKVVFSTCNTENKDCRGWEINTGEFNHDKEKKIFEYKDSWLKIFDYRVFYIPYFNHPDPTVKRRSGFLTPTYSTSENLGNAFTLPYFKEIAIDKDITLNPRFYADKSFLLQNEYRQALENSKILTDFSFLVGEKGTKSHLFYNQVGKIDEIKSYEINLQSVKGDNYLKNHKLVKTSSLITNDDILLSNFDLNWNFKESNLSTSFKVYEDLSANYHDRYQYIFPNYNFSRKINIPKNYNGTFEFNSYGYNKNYNTNVTETVLTNDFLFKSNDFINSKGLISNFDILLKNSSNYSNNSTNFEDDENYDLFGIIKLDSSIPMRKKIDGFNHYITPIASIRYSPNGNNDLSEKNIILNYDSVFDLNRIGSSYQVEGGESLSLGFEFKREEFDGTNVLDLKFANVLKPDNNNNLPSKSKLDKTRSDIFGSLNYNFNNNIRTNYFFSYDRDLKHSNLEQLNLEFLVNNIITGFSYYTEDNEIGNIENIKNNTNFKIDNENKISFEIAKNLRDDFTQFYDLIYTYETDCLSLNLNYNRSFYSDGNLEPNKSISFLVKIIPFSEFGISNFGRLVGQ